MTVPGATVTLILDDTTLGGGVTVTNGDVALVVYGSNTVHGSISAASDLTVSGDGTLTVDVPEDGITVWDDLTLEAGADTVKSTKDDDPAKEWVRVTGGMVTATAGDDAVTAVTDDLVEGGTLRLTATDKAINAGTSALVDAGTVTLSATDDGLHSDGALRISGGEVTVDAGDDGAHSEVASLISGGKVNLEKSEEALESGLVTITDGEVNLSSNDDGINASGSTTVEEGLAVATAKENTDESATATPGGGTPGEPPSGMTPGMAGAGGPGGGGPMEDSTGEQLVISGGTIVVNPGGDGIDSNGDVKILGGNTINGPENDGNGALDVQGEFAVEGGTL